MPCRKDWTKAQEAVRSPNESHATRGRLVETWARAPRGHAIAAAPPSSDTNSRRPRPDMRGPSLRDCRSVSLPPTRPVGLGAGLKCSEIEAGASHRACESRDIKTDAFRDGHLADVPEACRCDGHHEMSGLCGKRGRVYSCLDRPRATSGQRSTQSATGVRIRDRRDTGSLTRWAMVRDAAAYLAYLPRTQVLTGPYGAI